MDDVQAGAEACSRTADTLIADASRLDGHLKGPFGNALTRHLKDLKTCTRDQRSALRELRAALALLREELTVSQRAAIKARPSASAAAEEA